MQPLSKRKRLRLAEKWTRVSPWHTGPGTCYRLYTEMAFKHEMLNMTVGAYTRPLLSST